MGLSGLGVLLLSSVEGKLRIDVIRLALEKCAFSLMQVKGSQVSCRPCTSCYESLLHDADWIVIVLCQGFA